MRNKITGFILISILFSACGTENASDTSDRRDASNACWVQANPPADAHPYLIQKYPGQSGRWYVGVVQPGVEYLHQDFAETNRDDSYLYLTLQGGSGAGDDLGRQFRIGRGDLTKLVGREWVVEFQGSWTTCGAQ